MNIKGHVEPGVIHHPFSPPLHTDSID